MIHNQYLTPSVTAVEGGSFEPLIWVILLYTCKGPNFQQTMEQRRWSAAPTHQPSGHREAPWRAAFQGLVEDHQHLWVLVGKASWPKVGGQEPPNFLRAGTNVCETIQSRQRHVPVLPNAAVHGSSVQRLGKDLAGSSCTIDWCLCQPLRQTQLITHLLKWR